MAEAFDPYHKWLGIPPQEQPPNHYRLLGLQVFEGDPDVIANAADRQMSHVRTYQTGKNAVQSQRLLNEISAAKICLLTAQKKGPYDQALRASLPATQPANDSAADKSDDRVLLDFEPEALSSAIRRDRAKPAPKHAAQPALKQAAPKSKQLNPLILLGGGVAALIVIVILALLIPRGGNDEPSGPNLAGGGTVVEPSGKIEPTPVDTPAQGGNDQPSGGNPVNPPVTPPDNDPPKPPTVVVRPVLPTVGSENNSDSTEAPPPPPTPAGSPLPPPLSPMGTPIVPEGTYALRLTDANFIDVLDTASLFDRGEDFTAEAWMFILQKDHAIGVMSNREMNGQVATIGWLYVLTKTNPPDRFTSQLSLTHPKTIIAGMSVGANVWRHLCVHHSGDRLKISVDGRKILSHYLAKPAPTGHSNLRLGYAKNGGGFRCYAGQDIAAFRFSAGDRYPANFTPPVRFERDGQTLCLLDFSKPGVTQLADLTGNGRDGLVSSGLWVDRNGNNASAAPPAIVNNNPPAVVEPPAAGQPATAPPPAAAGPTKQPPPENAKVAAARAQVRDLFKAEIAAAKTMEERTRLAQALLAQAEKSRDDATSQYALSLESLRLATEGGNWTQAVQTIDSLSEVFEVDVVALKTDALIAVGKLARGPQAKQAMITVGMLVLDDAVNEQRSDLVSKLVPALQSASLESRDVEQRKKLVARSNEIKKLQQEWGAIDAATETLKTKPDDPGANLLVGRNLCLYKNRWDEGLPMLAKSNDPIGNAAQQDLSKPADSPAQIRTGDLWWDLAERESGTAKSALGKRAGYWYEKAMPGAVGLERTRLEKRLADVGMPYQEPARPGVAPPVAGNNPAPVEPPPPAGMPRSLAIELGLGAKINLRLVSPGSVTRGTAVLARVDKPFYLGLTEVTQGQWSRIMGSNPSQAQGNNEMPVENVSYDDCLSFLAKLTRGSNGQLSFRLPTTAEWQYAARAGSVGGFCFGDDETLLGQYAYFKDNASNTRVVKQLQPNGYGFYDMHGNVGERVAELQPDGRSLALGGSFRSTPISCSFGGRHTTPRDNVSGDIGFRVACDMLVAPQPKQP